MNKSNLYIKLLVFLSLGLFFGYTIASSFHKNNKANQILEVLLNDCNCKEVNQIIYAQGIQFGKDGFSTEKGEYQLIDCEFLSLDKELERIQNLLHQKVTDFNELDLLELEFVNDGNIEVRKFKNGILNN